MYFFHLFHRDHQQEIYLRNFLFGIEDSLVSTVGLLAGVAAANVSRETVITMGLVLIFVEGFSMGIGSFLTEETTEEMSGQKPDDVSAFQGAIVMLLSYCLAGLLPLLPYTIFDFTLAVPISVILSLIGLFCLGYGTAYYYNRPSPWKRALKMFFLGGAAVAIGMLIGQLFHV